MRALVQRVRSASVTVAGETVAEIGIGMVALVCVAGGDDAAAAERLAGRLHHLRIFPDASGQANLSVADCGHDILVVSQFTLCADTTRGRRPSYLAAAQPEQAEPVVGALVEALRSAGARVATGRFGAEMEVALVNDGPFTLLIEA